MAITRRTFLKRVFLSGAVAATTITQADKALAGVSTNEEYGTVIDLTKCNGCVNYDTPLCTLACRNKNKKNFPVPEKPIMDYWPQPKHEDWSDKKDLTNRLTPYNWTYVQHVNVEYNGKKIWIHVPRRCMHCDNPPCSGLCPFGVNQKTPEGAVVIDTDICFGGAKCRDVCLWEIPQRQAGVGLYKQFAPQYVGGGVMYKCDFCFDLITDNKEPACVSACPQNAIIFGLKSDMLKYAQDWSKKNNGYIYGDIQNGGTSTFYLSPVPFSAINDALKEQEIDGKPGRPTMEPEISNPLEKLEGMAKGFILAPLAGVLAAGLNAYKIMKGGKTDENSET